MSAIARADTAVGSVVIPEEVRGAVAEFLARASEIPNLHSAVLYGSAVRGEMHHKSDIDVLLLFDTDHNPELGVEAEIAVSVAGDAVMTSGCPYEFSFVISNIRDLAETDTDYLWNVAREGIVIWGRPEYVLPTDAMSLSPYLIITYDLSDLSARDKRAVHRALYGYRVTREVDGRRYESSSQGLVRGRSRRLGKAVILIPAREAGPVVAVLHERGARWTETKVWHD